jgi:hypothetical protein
MSNLYEEFEEILHEWPHLNRYPFRGSKEKFGNGAIGDVTVDPRHIEYEPRTVQQRIQHSNMISEELHLRNISYNNLSPPEQRLMLQEVLMTEH